MKPTDRPAAVDRRTLLKGLAVLGAGIALPGAAFAAPQDSKPAAKAKEPRTILILGGTGFLGPKVVGEALARGHKVTLFNRGKTNPHLFPEVEKLKGDRRKGDYESLKGERTWDAVVDTSAYFPRQVREIADVLGSRVNHYVCISSVSVYPDADSADTDEKSPVGKMADETVETMGKQFENYGPLKALCEQAAEKAYPGRTTNLRPGLIVGDGDDTERFAYWPLRVAEGGEVLAPMGPDQTIQVIDVKDLGRWIVRMIEDRVFGVYNAISPALPMGDVLAACKKASGSDATFTYVSREFLEEEKVAPWGDLPAWFPPAPGKEKCAVASVAKIAALGYAARPIEETARDVVAYDRARKDKPAKRGGLSREREKELLAKWKARNQKK
jgi:2'-hydroxyisoflavone reductase